MIHLLISLRKIFVDYDSGCMMIIILNIIYMILLILVLLFLSPYNQDDGSCLTSKVDSRTNPLATNYYNLANVDDGSCIGTLGRTAPLAFNYDENSLDDGSCLGCTDPSADNYNDWAGVDDGSCSISGCTNEVAATIILCYL